MGSSSLRNRRASLELVEYSHLKHGVLFSAIVVNKPNIANGDMEPGALKGFIGAARLLGYAVNDAEAFLKEQQAQVFAWARSELPATP